MRSVATRGDVTGRHHSLSRLIIFNRSTRLFIGHERVITSCHGGAADASFQDRIRAD